MLSLIINSSDGREHVLNSVVNPGHEAHMKCMSGGKVIFYLLMTTNDKWKGNSNQVPSFIKGHSFPALLHVYAPSHMCGGYALRWNNFQ